MVEEFSHTTHLSVADGRGMVVALTQSLGPAMGAKVAAPGLGFVYAATMGYLGSLSPGDRPSSGQSPLIVLRDGDPAYVLGAAGGARIISAIVEVTSRVVDQQLSLSDAMAAPRFHATTNYIRVEDRPGAQFAPSDLADLRSFGFTVTTSSSSFGLVHALAYDVATREWIGVADPRGSGAAMGTDR